MQFISHYLDVGVEASQQAPEESQITFVQLYFGPNLVGQASYHRRKIQLLGKLTGPLAIIAIIFAVITFG